MQMDIFGDFIVENVSNLLWQSLNDIVSYIGKHWAVVWGVVSMFIPITLQVINNVHDGVEIMKNDVYSNAALRHSVVENNQGNGVSTRGSFFEMFNCTLQNNAKSGFEYNPHYTTYEARQLRIGIHDALKFTATESFYLGIEARKFVVTDTMVIQGTRRYILEIYVDFQHRVVMDIIDYTPVTVRENVTVYDSRKQNINNTGIRFWKIEEDLPDFPVESQDQYLTIVWDIRAVSSGRFTFVVRSSKSHKNY